MSVFAQVTGPYFYYKYPSRDENNNYCLPYGLYVTIAGITFVVFFVYYGDGALVAPAFLFQLLVAWVLVSVQQLRNKKGKDKINRNHAWMCILALGSYSYGVGIGAALLALIASTDSIIVASLIWFLWAFVVSGMLLMFIKMVEWSLPQESQALVTFSIQFADDFFSELV